MKLTPEMEDRVNDWYSRLDPKQRQALLDHPAVRARLGATFVPTPRQQEAEALLDGSAIHVLLWGGSRSGKTALICRKIVQRALRAPKSRHLIARFRFNHVIQSIWHDTLPKVLATSFPGLEIKQDKASFFWELPNGSQIWFGGLDDKERAEKALGNEYSSIFLNECSQIGLAARNLIVTRLAQNVGLKLLAAYDENPPISTHWTHRLFVEKREAVAPYGKLANPEAYAHLQMNPADNAANLPATYLEELKALPARERLRFWEGRFGDVGENALWSFELIETYRVSKRPDLRRIIVAVDPSGTKGDTDDGDYIGIVVVGLGLDGAAYVLEDASVKAPPSAWGRVVVSCADRHEADCIVAETNYGGSLVEAVVKAAAADAKLRINFKEVKATRGKVVRAEPVAALYEQGKVHHVGSFPELEDQLAAFSTHGYLGDGSPDRADALIWGLTEIFPRVVSRGDADWKTTRPHRDRPKFANVGYSQMKGAHFQRNGGSQR
jgi:predicted phage terminase large subunit-like protein